MKKVIAVLLCIIPVACFGMASRLSKEEHDRTLRELAIQKLRELKALERQAQIQAEAQRHVEEQERQAELDSHITDLLGEDAQFFKKAKI